MKKNLVLTAAIGLGINQSELFIKSLRKYYNDDIYFVVGPNDNLIKQELKKYNCICLQENIDKRDIQLKRYEIFLEFLKDKNYNNILCCDSRDIYFQSNPFDFNYKGAINFFLEDEKIKNYPYNSNWIIKTYGKAAFDNISDKIILCSGSVLGSIKKIKEYLSLMKDKISQIKYKKKLKYLLTLRRDPEGKGCDQGHTNYLVHKNIIKDFYLYSNTSGPFATVFYLKKIIFDSQSRLLNNSGNPYLLVHQYDKKWKEFSQQIITFKNNL